MGSFTGTRSMGDKTLYNVVARKIATSRLSRAYWKTGHVACIIVENHTMECRPPYPFTRGCRHRLDELPPRFVYSTLLYSMQRPHRNREEFHIAKVLQQRT